MSIKIAIASDHAGFDLKQSLINSKKFQDIEFIDLGPDNKSSVDYPDYAAKLAKFLKNEKVLGILICGTGIGISIAANRFPHIRAALCHNVEVAKLSREHNDANVLVLGARVTKERLAHKILAEFIKTKFAGARHKNRVEKLSCVKI